VSGCIWLLDSNFTHVKMRYPTVCRHSALCF